MSSQTIDLIKYFGASVIPVLASLLTLRVSNRHAAVIARETQQHEKEMAQAAAHEARTEHRYAERLEAITRLITEATAIRRRALEDEERGKEAPEAYLDGPDLESYFRPLREALNALLLVGSQRTRAVAERVQLATERYAWGWETSDYQELDQALIDLRAAARADLGIDGGAHEAVTAKPQLHGPGGERPQQT